MTARLSRDKDKVQAWRKSLDVKSEMKSKNGMPPVHPGELLLDEIEYLKIAPAKFAEMLTVPVEQLQAILDGERDVDSEFALRLERFFGSGARMWMNLQTTYSLNVAEWDLGKTIVDEVVPLEDEEARTGVVETA